MIRGTPHYCPQVDDPDPPEYWDETQWDDFRNRVRAYHGRAHDAAWEEEKHPRDEIGRWTSGGGAGSSSSELVVPPPIGARAMREESESIRVPPDPRIDARAPSFEVLKNGRYDEIRRMAKEFGGSVRVGLDPDGNLYAWDAGKALHEHIEDEFGYQGSDLRRDVWTLHGGKLTSEASLGESLAFSGKPVALTGSNAKHATPGQMRAAQAAVRDWAKGDTITRQLRVSYEQEENYYAAIEEAPTNEGIEAAEANWRGSVANFGDPQAALDVQSMQGYFEYRSHLEEAARENLGEEFPVYRLMRKEQLEDWQNGADIDPVGTTLNPAFAEKFENFAGFDKTRGGDRVVVRIPATPESIVMRGAQEESEIVINPNEISGDTIEIMPRAGEREALRKTPAERLAAAQRTAAGPADDWAAYPDATEGSEIFGVGYIAALRGEADKMAAKLGFPPEDIRFKVGIPRTPDGGMAQGCYTYDRMEITIFPMTDSPTPDLLRATLAHEINHHQYAMIMNRWRKEAGGMTKEESADYGREKNLDAMAAKYPVAVAMRPYALDHTKKHAAEGARVSQYASGFWAQVKRTGAYNLAMSETLAEIAHERERLGETPPNISKWWRAHADTVDRLYKEHFGK